MLPDFYKIIYNFYVSKNEKDIPHSYAVGVICVLQVLNILTIIMLIDMYKMKIFLDKSDGIKLSMVIMVLNFIYYHKYKKKNLDLFEVSNKMKRLFLIYLVSTIVFWLGLAIFRTVNK